MSATVTCPECKAPLEAPDDLPAGKQLQCPDCGAAFAPPAGVSATPAAKPAPAPRPRRRPEDYETEEEPAPASRGSGVFALLVGLVVVIVVLLCGAGLALPLLMSARSASVPPPPPAQVAVQPAPMPAGPGPMQPGGPAVQLKPGDVAPEIDGEDLDGKAMKLSDFRGNVVVLVFWGDWSPFCKPAYAYLNNLQNRLKGEPLVGVGVNSDATKELAQAVVKDQKIAWRSWHDGGGNMMGGPIYTRYGIRPVPTTFVLDKQGRIYQRFDQEINQPLLDRTVDEALAADRPRPPGAPPRWSPLSMPFGQLGDEVAVGPYLVRPPKGYALTEPEPQTFLWKGPARPDGTAPLIQVALSPARRESRPVEVLEKEVEGVPVRRVGSSFSRAEVGEVNGLNFTRSRWSGTEKSGKRREAGFVYVAVDGDTLVRITARDTEPHAQQANPVAEAAALTFRKPKK